MDWRSGPIPQVFRAAYVCPLTGHPVNRIGFPAVFRDKGRASAGTVSSERERKPIVANLNVTYGDMQSAASQLRAGQQQMESDLARLKSLVDNLVASGYVTDASSKQFDVSYTEFNSGATKMMQGLAGMGQYLDAAARAFQETDTQLAASLK